MQASQSTGGARGPADLTMLGVVIVAASLITILPAAAAGPPPPGLASRDLSAQQRRPRITVTPRRTVLGPHAVRQCRAWLAREVRPSGTVVVPRQQCWWE